MAGKVANPLKAALRREILVARDALAATERARLSAHITQQLRALEAYRNAACVLAYMSFGSEFDTAQLVQDVLANGKQLCLPRLNRDTRQLELHLADNLEHLENGVWGIREPRADSPRAELARIDFVLLPGVAFTPRCERLGYGGGHYDRLITQFATCPPLIAATFALQMRDQIPFDADDQYVDVVVTESSFHARSNQ